MVDAATLIHIFQSFIVPLLGIYKVILLLGPTGHGKSTFIEKVTGLSGIGKFSGKSVTSKVTGYPVPMTQEFYEELRKSNADLKWDPAAAQPGELGKGKFILFDTPGFCDTEGDGADQKNLNALFALVKGVGMIHSLLFVMEAGGRLLDGHMNTVIREFVSFMAPTLPKDNAGKGMNVVYTKAKPWDKKYDDVLKDTVLPKFKVLFRGPNVKVAHWHEDEELELDDVTEMVASNLAEFESDKVEAPMMNVATRITQIQEEHKEAKAIIAQQKKDIVVAKAEGTADPKEMEMLRELLAESIDIAEQLAEDRKVMNNDAYRADKDNYVLGRRIVCGSEETGSHKPCSLVNCRFSQAANQRKNGHVYARNPDDKTVKAGCPCKFCVKGRRDAADADDASSESESESVAGSINSRKRRRAADDVLASVAKLAKGSALNKFVASTK